MRHFIDLFDWDAEQISALLQDAARLKRRGGAAKTGRSSRAACWG